MICFFCCLKLRKRKLYNVYCRRTLNTLFFVLFKYPVDLKSSNLIKIRTTNVLFSSALFRTELYSAAVQRHCIL